MGTSPGLAAQSSILPSNWLAALNYLRRQADLPGVKASDRLSTNARKHARYMVKNQKFQHHEDRGDPYFSWAGHEAGLSSNILASPVSRPGGYVMTLMWVGPFHGLGLLNPALRRSGYGTYAENNGPRKFDFAAVLDHRHGIGRVPRSVDYPVKWPGPDVTTSLGHLPPGEYPDPVRGCGFSYPTGAPIYVLLKRPSPVVGHSLKADGDAVKHCVYDKNTYKNPSDSARKLGRLILKSYKAIVVIPKEPLRSEAEYDVVVRTKAKRIAWSFTTSDLRAPETVITYPENTGSPPVPYPASAVETFTGTSSIDTTKVEIALKQVREEECRWWTGSAFVEGGCSARRWLDATGTTEWQYTLSEQLTPPAFDNDIYGYILYSRGTDAAGNTEFVDELGPNRVQFTVSDE